MFIFHNKLDIMGVKITQIGMVSVPSHLNQDVSLYTGKKKKPLVKWDSCIPSECTWAFSSWDSIGIDNTQKLMRPSAFSQTSAFGRSEVTLWTPFKTFYKTNILACKTQHKYRIGVQVFTTF